MADRIVQVGVEEVSDVWMDGFASGVSTAVRQFVGLSDEDADLVSDKACRQLKADPLAMAAVYQEVEERMQGVDGGPKNVKVFGSEPPHE
jgi:hypothetical protein